MLHLDALSSWNFSNEVSYRNPNIIKERLADHCIRVWYALQFAKFSEIEVFEFCKQKTRNDGISGFYH